MDSKYGKPFYQDERTKSSLHSFFREMVLDRSARLPLHSNSCALNARQSVRRLRLRGHEAEFVFGENYTTDLSKTQSYPRSMRCRASYLLTPARLRWARLSPYFTGFFTQSFITELPTLWIAGFRDNSLNSDVNLVSDGMAAPIGLPNSF